MGECVGGAGSVEEEVWLDFQLGKYRSRNAEAESGRKALATNLHSSFIGHSLHAGQAHLAQHAVGHFLGD